MTEDAFTCFLDAFFACRCYSLHAPCPRGKNACICNGNPSFVSASLRLGGFSFTKVVVPLFRVPVGTSRTCSYGHVSRVLVVNKAFVLSFDNLITTVFDYLFFYQEIEVGNGNNKLFGGAQYHRALREFNFAIRHMNAPEVKRLFSFFMLTYVRGFWLAGSW